MSVNCIRCVANHRDGPDLLCAGCRCDRVKNALALYAAARNEQVLALVNRGSHVGIASASDEQARRWQEAEGVAVRAWRSVFGTAEVLQFAQARTFYEERQ